MWVFCRWASSTASETLSQILSGCPRCELGGKQVVAHGHLLPLGPHGSVNRGDRFNVEASRLSREKHGTKDELEDLFPLKTTDVNCSRYGHGSSRDRDASSFSFRVQSPTAVLFRDQLTYPVTNGLRRHIYTGCLSNHRESTSTEQTVRVHILVGGDTRHHALVNADIISDLAIRAAVGRQVPCRRSHPENLRCSP